MTHRVIRFLCSMAVGSLAVALLGVTGPAVALPDAHWGQSPPPVGAVEADLQPVLDIEVPSVVDARAREVLQDQYVAIRVSDDGRGYEVGVIGVSASAEPTLQAQIQRAAPVVLVALAIPRAAVDAALAAVVKATQDNPRGLFSQVSADYWGGAVAVGVPSSTDIAPAAAALQAAGVQHVSTKRVGSSGGAVDAMADVAVRLSVTGGQEQEGAAAGSCCTHWADGPGARDRGGVHE